MYRPTIGKIGKHNEKNENERKLIEISREKRLKMRDSLSQYRDIHKVT